MKGNKNPKFNNYNIEFKYKESVFKTRESTASAFNEYFATVGPNLANLIEHTEKDLTKYVKGSYPHSMFLFPTSPSEVHSLIMKEKCNKAAGFDDISINVLKAFAMKISEPLSCIFNNSLKTGIFPEPFPLKWL